MASRNTPFVPGEYYHIFNRGNSKQAIFLGDDDYKHFIKCLFLCNSLQSLNFRDNIVAKNIDAFEVERGEPLVSIGAWVLIPNHFHLYLTFSQKPGFEENEESENNISRFMQKLMTAYTKYFNAKHNRTGTLYEGKFKSTHAANNNHAKYLFSYIHLNPMKVILPQWGEEGKKDTKLALECLSSYKWSSYNDHRGIKRPENKILHLKDFPEYFSSLQNFDSEIVSWLEYEQ